MPRALPTSVRSRSGFHVGQKIRTNGRFRKVSPRSKVNNGYGRLMWFCRGTEVQCMFPHLSVAYRIDERFIEAV